MTLVTGASTGRLLVTGSASYTLHRQAVVQRKQHLSPFTPRSCSIEPAKHDMVHFRGGW